LSLDRIWKRIKTDKKVAVLAAIFSVVLLILATSVILGEMTATQDRDPLFTRAMPYVEPVMYDNATLREIAGQAAAGGPTGDIEWQAEQVYRYVVDNYSYYSDPRDKDFIQAPFETMKIGGGDCEDLAIFLDSLLENLGIKTYIVVTDHHVFCLASGLDTDSLASYGESGLVEQASRDISDNEDMPTVVRDGKIYLVKSMDEKLSVRPGYMWYYGGDESAFPSGIKSMSMEYSVNSSGPLTVYGVPTKADYELSLNNKNFTTIPGSELKSVYSFNDSCYMKTNGGIVLRNDNAFNVTVDVHLVAYYEHAMPDNITYMAISYYTLDNQTCVVMDPTAGKYGYPGCSGNFSNETIVAIDPVTLEHHEMTGNASVIEYGTQT
jgi:hypothetical protein